MPTQRLVIDGSDYGRFFLSVKDGTLTAGSEPDRADLVLPNLHIVGVHCVIEVEEAAVVIGNGSGADTLRPGHELHVGRAHLSLIPAETEAAVAVADPEEIVEPEPETPAGPSRWLVVLDGADRGRRFQLNATGRTAIGKSPRHADVVLHDFYVARVHCELHVQGDHVLVTHVEGHGGTLINGKSIVKHELQVGDVLRVGNSFLRYQLSVDDVPPDGDTSDEVTAVTTTELPAVKKSGILPSAAAPPRQADPLEPLLKLPGQALGHYQVEALLGRGHAGAVFRALDRKTNQPLTLKVLAPEFPASEAEAQNFVKAVKQVAPLRHANLVTVYAAGKTGPFCWLAREYIEGESLAALTARLVKEGRLGWKRACRFALQLGQVLDYLQQRQLVHANLTPANVLVATAAKAVKLSDLVLARALAGSKLEAALRERKQFAELAHWAPEQLESGAPVDACSSIYALGTLIYGLLTGRPPVTGIAPADFLSQLRDGKLVRPSKHLPETPAPFEAAVLKMLAPRREDRYQSAAEMLLDIEPIASMHQIQ